MEHFNKLTPAEAERLAILAEECGEVIQIVGKILRHGYHSYNPHDEKRTTNRMLLERELGDVRYAISRMEEVGDVYGPMVATREMKKADAIRPYLHHN